LKRKIKQGKENEQDLHPAHELFSFSFLDDLLAVIITALGAYMMGHPRLMALRAGRKSGGFQFPIGTALVTTSL
jgi:hypothetical protein